MYLYSKYLGILSVLVYSKYLCILGILGVYCYSKCFNRYFVLILVPEAKEELSLDSPENDWSHSAVKQNADPPPQVGVSESSTAPSASVPAHPLLKQARDSSRDVSSHIMQTISCILSSNRFTGLALLSE